MIAFFPHRREILVFRPILNQIENLTVTLIPIINKFYGESVTVTGLFNLMRPALEKINNIITIEKAIYNIDPAIMVAGTTDCVAEYEGILSIIDTIGSFFGQIAGVVIADYYLIRNKEYVSKDMFSDSKSGNYFYSNGWQIKGVYAMFIGFIFAASTIWNVELRFLQSFAWIVGALVSYLTYYLLASK